MTYQTPEHPDPRAQDLSAAAPDVSWKSCVGYLTLRLGNLVHLICQGASDAVRMSMEGTESKRVVELINLVDCGPGHATPLTA
jgi:hypothetical protein